MRIYLDSSALVAVLFEEPGFTAIRKLLAKSDQNLSSLLLEAEVCSAAKREGVVASKVRKFLEFVSMAYPDRPLTKEYEQIFSHGYCRGADALHLATALFLDPDAANLHFLTCDKTQAQVARAIGFQTPLL